jgi:CHAD domain-containing protein
MSYRFKTKERIGTGISRIARERLAWALHRVRSAASKPDSELVHDVRKTLKKLRSLLRLARRHLKKSAFRSEDAALQRMAGRLAPMRDAQICVAALDKLHALFQKGKLPAEFSGVRRALALHHGKTCREEKSDGCWQRLARELNAALIRCSRWKLEDGGRRDLRRALKRSYKRARNSFAAAQRKPKASNLHAWRKRAKDFYHHLCLVQPGCGKLIRELDALTEFLGDERDLEVLRKTLLASGANAFDAKVAEEILNHAEMRGSQLRRAAFALGENLFAEKPRDFLARIENGRLVRDKPKQLPKKSPDGQTPDAG